MELAGDRILVTILINVGLVVAISKQGVGHRSEDVEKNIQLYDENMDQNINNLKLTLSHTVHSNLVSFLAYFTLFNIANVFINSIFWFLKLELTVLCRAGTHGRKMYCE